MNNILDKGWIYWKDQCMYCKNKYRTDVCFRNMEFMKKLNSMWKEYIGTVNFKCDYFENNEEDYNVLKNVFRDYGENS